MTQQQEKETIERFEKNLSYQFGRPVKIIVQGKPLEEIERTEIAQTAFDVMFIVASVFGIAVGDIRGFSRSRNFVTARNITCFILRSRYHYNLSRIGHLMGDRDHTTILHNINMYNTHYQVEPDFKAKADECLMLISYPYTKTATHA